jgi:hypothetical protein
MKKILEEEIVMRNSYASTMGIHMGKFATKISFWPEVSEIVRVSNVSKIQTKADDVREATSWKYLIDHMSVQAVR